LHYLGVKLSISQYRGNTACWYSRTRC